MSDEKKTEQKVMSESAIVSGIKKSIADLNGLLIEAKRNPDIQVAISAHGVGVDGLGIVNLVEAKLQKTTKL